MFGDKNSITGTIEMVNLRIVYWCQFNQEYPVKYT